MSSEPKSSGTGRRSSRHQANRAAPSGAAVLYIHPAKQGPAFRADANLGRSYGLFPVGLPALVNRLRENQITVQGIVHPLEMQLDTNFRLDSWLRERSGARVILIDLHWYEHCYGAVETARLCKKILPRAAVVLGGLSASGFASEIMENFSAVDYIIRGDAELPLLNLVQLLLGGAKPPEEELARVPNLVFRGKAGLVENPLTYTATTEDLDTLNFADIDFIAHARECYVHEYIVTDLSKARLALQTSPFTGRWITTARGCKYECSYCGGGKSAHKKLAGRKGLIIRSAKPVAAEIAHLRELGVEQVSFAYDIAEMGEEYWQELFAEIRRLGVKIGMYNEFFQLPTVDFINAVADTADQQHSCVALSPLSGDERVRRMNGKHYNNEALFDVLDALAQRKMYLFVYFSLNLPGETLQTIEDTVQLAKDIYDFYPHALLKILNTVHTIDPLSPMNVKDVRFGIRSHMRTFLDYYSYCRDTGNQDPASRTGYHRGFEMTGRSQSDQETMVKLWEQARVGREGSWWPVPPGW